jgi:hypothetical protein
MGMKTTLIFLWTLAGALGLFVYFAIFGGSSGTYGINPLPSSTHLSTSTVFTLPSSTASSSFGGSTSTNTSFYGTQFGTPPATWHDGDSDFSITAASFQNNQVALTLTIQMGGAPACVPLNIRFVADESGHLQEPDANTFLLPDSGNCNGAANATYRNQVVTFNIDATRFPLLFTTGGSSNLFFELATTTNNGLQITLPGTSG